MDMESSTKYFATRWIILKLNFLNHFVIPLACRLHRSLFAFSVPLRPPPQPNAYISGENKFNVHQLP
jgi:hypothetical protein